MVYRVLILLFGVFYSCVCGFPLQATTHLVKVVTVMRMTVAKQRTAGQRNDETVRQLQMELDAHGGLVPPPNVFVDGKETCGRSREDHYVFDDTWIISGKIKSHWRRLRRRSWTFQQSCVQGVHI